MNKTLQEVGVSISTIKRRLHESKYRGFTVGWKPLITLKNRKATLDFAKKHKRNPVKSVKIRKIILWTEETKINLYQNDGTKKV